MKDPRDIIIKPVVSEKSYGLVDSGVYTFVVAKDANKIEIRSAVEALFKVTVTQVRTLIARGKIKRVGRFSGRRPAWKKAIVTLKAGDQIAFFEGV